MTQDPKNDRGARREDLPDVSRRANEVAANAPDPLMQLTTFLRAREDALAVGIYKGLSPQRLIDIVCIAASRAPDLLQCTPMSIYRSLKQCAQLGLEPHTAQRHAYLVPFRNKNGTREAQLIVGYQGLCEVAHRHKRVKAIRAHVVYEDDDCVVELEPPSVRHRWAWQAENREDSHIIGAYAVAELDTGGYVVEPMTIAECLAIRARSKASASGPWVTDFPAMVRKCAIRRLLQRGSVPMSSELGQVLYADEDQEELTHVSAIVRDVIDKAAPPPPKRDASPGDLGDVDIPLDPTEPAKSAAPNADALMTSAEATDKLLGLAKQCGVGLADVFKVASVEAKKTVASIDDLRALPAGLLLDLVDRLEAQIERQPRHSPRSASSIGFGSISDIG